MENKDKDKDKDPTKSKTKISVKSKMRIPKEPNMKFPEGSGIGIPWESKSLQFYTVRFDQNPKSINFFFTTSSLTIRDFDPPKNQRRWEKKR
jgi:hypothetical protein